MKDNNTGQLRRYYTLYTGGFLAFIAALAVLEYYGMPAGAVSDALVPAILVDAFRGRL